MRINHTTLARGALFLALAFLTACGGGGGGSSTPAATTYTIGGTVSGLTGTGLVLQNNSGGNLAISADGSFAFATPQADGTTYQVTVLTQPSGQTCTVSASSSTVATANVNNVAVTCTTSTNSYTIGGAVTGLTGTGLVLQNNGGGNLAITATGSFAFATPQPSGSNYLVSVLTQPSGQTCTVTSASGIVTTANVATVAVACTTSTATYTIGGTVTGLVGTGLVLLNNGGGDLPISTNGNFVFATPQASGTTYQVTVLTQPTGQTCTVTPTIGAVSGANVTTVSVTCAMNTYTIGGTVTGLAGTATGFVLQNNGGNSLPVSAGASTFTFTTPIASGATYNVTIQTQPGTPTQTCTVNSPSGTVATANVTNVLVVCSTIVHSIGGAISGLTGSGLVLQNNGGDNLAASSVGYTFTTPLADGSTYTVTVLTQPTSPPQICTVANPSGTATAAVINADVSCVSTYTIGGTITGAADGIGPTLQNNLGDNLFIPAIAAASSVPFTFSTPVLNGDPYSVTQRIRARAPSQDCSAITGGSNGNGSGTVSGADVLNVSITCVLSTVVPKFAYVANSTANPATGAADTISAYTIAADGQLAATSTPTTATGDGPFDVAVEPTGLFAYVANSKSDSVSVYSINSAGGALTAIDADGATVGTQASITTGDNPKSIAVHPSGKFAYAVNQGNGSTTGNTISAYSINITSGALSTTDADGAASGVQASIATGAFPYAITVDPFGKFAYVANYNDSTLSGYTINPTTGALTSIGTVASGTNPSSIAIDTIGKCVLAANNTSDNVTSFAINSTTGVLTPVTVTATVSGSAPRSVAIDPNTGLYAYVANAGTGTISAYSVNPTTCAIASIDTDTAGGVQTSIAAGSVPFSINVDPSGQFVYVANFGSNNISIYNIAGGSGALTLVQTLSTGSGPVAVTTTQ